MKRPVVVIVGIAAGLVLVAAAGASAHTALQFVSNGVSTGNVLTDDASAPRTETPEASESPEAQPSETPETETEAADNDDQGEDNNDQGEDNSGSTTTGTHSESDSDKSSTSGGGGSGD